MRNSRLIQLVHCAPLIAALILLLGGAAYCAYLGNVLRFLPDESDYLTLAKNLVSQRAFTLDGTTPTAFRPPGYPLLLAAGMLIGLDVAELRWLNFVLLAGSLLLLAAIVRRMTTSAWAACIACGLFSCYPVLIYTAGTFYPQTLAGFLLLLCVWGLPLMADETVKPVRLVVSGLALGLLVLSVSLFAVSAAFILLWLMVTCRSLRQVAVVGSIVCLAMSLWTVRNYSQMGAFVPTSTNGGFNLLVGYSPLALPDASVNAGVNIDIVEYIQRGLTMNEVDRDRYFSQSALAIMSQDWIASIKLYLKKLVNHFNFRNRLFTQSAGSSVNDIVMFVGYYGLVVFAVIYCIRTGKNMGRFESLVLGLYLADALVSSIFFTRIRFRLPFDWLLIAFASIGLWRYVARKLIHL